MARVPDLSGNGPMGNYSEDRTALSDSAGDLYDDSLTVVPSDTVDIPPNSRALYIGGVGDLTVITREGTTQTFTAVPAGTLLKLAVKRVMSTGTTATLIKAMY